MFYEEVLPAHLQIWIASNVEVTEFTYHAKNSHIRYLTFNLIYQLTDSLDVTEMAGLTYIRSDITCRRLTHLESQY